MNIADIIEKVTHSKCPSCKKYGLDAMRGVGRSTYPIKCKYCGKRYRANWALTNFIIPIFAASVFAASDIAIQKLFHLNIQSPPVTAAICTLGVIFYLFLIRHCRIEEEPEEEENKPESMTYDIGGVPVAMSRRDKAVAYERDGKAYSVAFQEIKYKDFDVQLLGICKLLLADGRLSAFEYIIEYVLKYDRDFAMQYITRYAEGDFTRDELLKCKKIHIENIKKYAARLTDMQ